MLLDLAQVYCATLFIRLCSLLDGTIQCYVPTLQNTISNPKPQTVFNFTRILQSWKSNVKKSKIQKLVRKYEIYQRILLRIENIYLDFCVRFDWKYAYGCFVGREHWITSALADCKRSEPGPFKDTGFLWDESILRYSEHIRGIQRCLGDR